VALVRSKNLQKTFYEYLMKRPNIDMLMSRKLPKTEYQEDLKESFEDPLQKFMKHLIFTYRTKQCESMCIKSIDLFKKFETYLKEENCKFAPSHTKFGMKMKNIDLQGISKMKKRDGNYWTIDFKILETELHMECYKEEELILDSDSEDEYKPMNDSDSD